MCVCGGGGGGGGEGREGESRVSVCVCMFNKARHNTTEKAADKFEEMVNIEITVLIL